MRKATILIAIILSAVNAYSQHHFVQKLDSIATIIFPDTPKTKVADINSGFFYSTPNVRYIALVQDFRAQKFSLTADSLDSFYSGVTDGVSEASNTKGKLISKKNIVIDGFKGMEFEYESNLNPNVPNYRFQRMVLLNGKLYNYSFWTFKDSVKNNTVKKDIFFRSFHIIGNKENIKQYNNEGVAYNLAYLFGKLVGYCIMLTLAFLLIRWIIRLFRRNRQINNSDNIS